MKKYWKIGALILMLVIATITLASCDGEYYKTGNRITGGKDVQPFTYAYIGKKLQKAQLHSGAIMRIVMWYRCLLMVNTI